MNQTHFKKLFDSYFEEIRRYIFYKSGDPDLSEDITQSAFLKIWEKQVNILPGKERAFLYKIAHDEYVNTYRKKQSEFKFRANFLPDDFSTSPEEEIIYKQLNDKFIHLLESMKENQRVVFLMNRKEGLTYNEIAIRLNLSVKAVEKRMSAALKILKKELIIE